MIAAFHRAGFSHRDLKASNILVQLPTDSSAAPAVWLVDLKGVSKDTSTNAAKELRALTRLAASLLGYRSL
jgi:serine/threonine protein kinase